MRVQDTGIRRFLWVVPALFVAMTLVITWFLAQPLRGGGVVAGIGSWLLSGLVLSVPFLAALVVMLIARAPLVVRMTALGYAIAAGLAGLVMDISVLTSEGSTASVGLVVMLALQVFAMLPLAFVVALVVGVIRRRRDSHLSRQPG